MSLNCVQRIYNIKANNKYILATNMKKIKNI